MEREYTQESKDRLLKILKQKVTTSFIGAISEIEARFPNVKSDPKWADLRNAILTNGNAQIRSIERELEQYDVKWNRYQYNFIVRNQ